MTATTLQTLRESPLMRAGGWTVVRLLSPAALATLAAEAWQRHAAGAQTARLEASPDEDLRRGNPARHLESAAGGPALRALYHSPALRGLLRRLTGLRWEPSGRDGTFSYYCRPGHHLDLHRDVDWCDLAVITALHEHGAPGRGLGGALCLWPDRHAERLAAIRATPQQGVVPLRLAPGESAVLLGGHVPHAVPAVAGGQVRVVAPLCFRALAG